jgi:hypothetical protein
MTPVSHIHRATQLPVASAARRVTLLAALCLLSMVPRVAMAQGVGFAGEDPTKYGEMYRTYERLYGDALAEFDSEIKQLRSQGKNDAELGAAYERFRQKSIDLDRRYKQPVIEKLFDAANLRTSEFNTRTATSADPSGATRGSKARPGPSDPITPSKGTRPGDPGYRPWGADTDAQGGSRVVDQIPDVAREMGLTTSDADTLFAREPGYTTTDNNVLETTIHKSGRLDRVGSAAWQAKIEVDATRPETALHVDMQPGPMQDYVAVRDHESKARKGLDVPARNLLPGADEGFNLNAAVKLQGLVKGTLKSLDTAQLPDETLARLMREQGIEGNSATKLRSVLQSLKGGAAIVPESVGLSADNVDRFQNVCRALIDESARVTKERADAVLQEKLAQRDALEAAQDPEKAREIRREIVDARKRMEESERRKTRDAIVDLQKKLEGATTADKSGVPNAPDKAADSKRRQLLDQTDREITTRRNRQAIRDLYADVERRQAVDGDSVVRDLERRRGMPPATSTPRESGRPLAPEVPPTARGGLLTHPAVNRGLFVGGTLLATYSAFKEEYHEAEKRLIDRQKSLPDADRPPTRSEVLREMSFGRTGVRTALNLSGVEGAWMAGQALKYEWVQGTNDYIDAEIERRTRIQRALGQPEDDISFAKSAEIALKASIRQVTRATYEGAKGVPLLGDVVAMPENLFLVLDSSFGVIYDSAKRDRILATNTGDQAEDSAHIALQAERLVGEMRGLVAVALRQIETHNTLRRSSAQAESQVERVRDLFRADVQSLEVLLPQLGSAEKAPPPLPGSAEIQFWLDEIATTIRAANDLSTSCDRLEAALSGGRIECATVREQNPDLQGQLNIVQIRHESLREKDASWQQLLATLGPAAEARQLEIRLTALRSDAERLSRSLADAGRLTASVGEHLRGLREQLDSRRLRVRTLHGKYADRATPGARSEWDRILREANDLEIPAVPNEETSAASELLARAATHADLLARAEPPQLPAPLQPRRIDGQLSGDLERAEQPLRDLEAAVTRAVDKLDGLHQLCPVRSVFSLVADADKSPTIRFQVLGDSPATGGQLAYVWTFGDDSGPLHTTSATQSHTYSRAGEYQVAVRIVEESPNFSAERGEATASIQVAAPTTPPEPTPHAPGQVVLSVTPNVVLAGEVGRQKEDVDYLLLKNHPPGAYYGMHSLRIFHSLGTAEVEAECHFGIRMKLIPGGAVVIGLETYDLDIKAAGRGPIDPQTGQFRIALDDATWSERYPKIDGLLRRFTPEDRAAMQGVVLRALGGTPGQLGWSGEISGTMDWKSFKGGSGRFHLNRVFQGTWELPPAVAPYWVDWPTTVTKLGTGPAWLRFYPSEDVAHRQYLWRSRSGPMGGPKRILTDMGSEAALVPGRAALVRFGRWDMEQWWGVPNDPTRVREVLQAVQAFLEQEQIETHFSP